MQSTRWTSGCPRVNLALAWCCVPSEAARRATIIIKGEEADAAGSAILGQLLRYLFAGLLQRSQCWRHKEQRRERRTRLREGVWSAAAWEREGCGFAMFLGCAPSLFGVTGNGRPAHSLWTYFRQVHTPGSPLSKFGPFCNDCNGFCPPFHPGCYTISDNES